MLDLTGSKTLKRRLQIVFSYYFYHCRLYLVCNTVHLSLDTESSGLNIYFANTETDIRPVFFG